MADFVALSGDLAFRKDGLDIVAVGASVTASLEASDAVFVRLEDANFGLLAGARDFAFELTNGTLAVGLGPLAAVGADAVTVQYTNLTTTVGAGTSLSVAGLTYTFATTIAPDTVALSLEGFSAEVAGFVSLAGDLAFRRSGGDLVAVGNAVTAALEATDSVYARLENADFGLLAGATTFAFELTNGTLAVALGPLANLSVTAATVRYTTAATSVGAGTSLSAGALSYTFAEAIDADTLAFVLEGFSADIADFVSLAGDLALAREGNDLLAVGTGVEASLEASDSVFVRLAQADFRLRGGPGGFGFEMSNGNLTVALDAFASITTGAVLVQYTDSTRALTAGETLTVGTLSYTVQEDIAAGTIAFAVEDFAAEVGGFVSLEGDLGFRRDGDRIVATGSSVSARLDASDSVYARLTGADFGLLLGASTFGFELTGGVLDAALAPLANLSAGSVAVRYTNAETLIAAGTTLAVGTVSYTFAEQVLPDTVAFAVEDLAAELLGVATLSGDFALNLVDGDLAAIGRSVEAEIGHGNFGVGLTGGTLGLVHRSGDLAVEASGALALRGGDFATAAASRVTFAYNEAGLDLAGETLELGDLAFTFAHLPATADSLTVAAAGLEAELAGSLYLRGDFAFAANGTTGAVEAVAERASAGLRAGPVEIGVREASLALVVNAAGEKALEATGTLAAELPGDLSLTASTVAVRLNETGNAFTGETVAIAGVSHTFGDLEASSTLREVALGGVDLDLAGFLRVAGDFAVRAESDTVTLSDGSTASVEVLTLGASDASGFVGYHGGSSEALGLELAGVNAALALFAETGTGAPARTWTALDAEVDSVTVAVCPGSNWRSAPSASSPIGRPPTTPSSTSRRSPGP